MPWLLQETEEKPRPGFLVSQMNPSQSICQTSDTPCPFLLLTPPHPVVLEPFNSFLPPHFNYSSKFNLKSTKNITVNPTIVNTQETNFSHCPSPIPTPTAPTKYENLRDKTLIIDSTTATHTIWICQQKIIYTHKQLLPI